MKCPKCAWENLPILESSDEFEPVVSPPRFCGTCGAALMTGCPVCGTGHAVGTKYCQRDGRNIALFSEERMIWTAERTTRPIYPIGFKEAMLRTRAFVSGKVLLAASSLFLLLGLISWYFLMPSLGFLVAFLVRAASLQNSDHRNRCMKEFQKFDFKALRLEDVLRD